MAMPTLLDYATPAQFQPPLQTQPQIEWPDSPSLQVLCWTVGFFVINFVVLGFTVWSLRRILDFIVS